MQTYLRQPRFRGGEMIAALRGKRFETWIGVLSIVLVAVILFGGYARHYVLAYDDWGDLAIVHFGGISAEIQRAWALAPDRPLEGLVLGSVNAVFGGHAHMLMALTLALKLGSSLLIYIVFRLLRLGALVGWGVALLYLLYPWADSTALWAKSYEYNAAICLWLLGAVVTINAIGRADRARVLHVTGVVLYVASMFLYDATPLAVLVTGIVYLRRASRARALRWWGAEAGIAAVAILLVTSRVIHYPGEAATVGHPTESIPYILNHIRLIAGQGLDVAAVSLVPFGHPSRWVVLALWVGVMAVASWALCRMARSDPRRPVLRDMFQLEGAGVVLAVAGWGMYAPTDDWYSPGTLGVGNRVNAVAGLGLTVLAVSTFVLMVVLALAAVRVTRPALTLWGGIALVLAAALGYGRIVVTDRDAWSAAAASRLSVLADIRNAVGPSVSRHTTLIAFGFPEWQALGVPVFSADWDLNGAVQIQWADPTLTAWPATAGQLLCESTGVSVEGISSTPAPYGTVIVVDTDSQSVSHIRNADECRQAASRITTNQYAPGA